MRNQQERECFEKIKSLARNRNDMRLLSFLNGARENPESSLFPDFLFDGVFIEHFQVSAAIENKKGSEHNIAVNDFERGSNENIERLKNEFLQLPPRKNPVTGTYVLKVVTHEMESPEYAYESFVKSFKRNFEKHIESLQKYTGDKSIGIFLIELAGPRLTVLQNNNFRAFYRLAIDRDLLEYIDKYTAYLKYIFFVSLDDYEVLELNKIPHLLNNIPQGLTFGVGRFRNMNWTLFIGI